MTRALLAVPLALSTAMPTLAASAADSTPPATVTAVGATIDPQTRSASLKASVPAVPGIVVGRAISVQLLGTPPKGAVAVPPGALVRLDGRPVVFTEAAGGFIPRPVAIADSGGGLTAVTGLPAGTRIAVSGTSELKALAGAH